jgi:hypothetical protein
VKAEIRRNGTFDGKPAYVLNLTGENDLEAIAIQAWMEQQREDLSAGNSMPLRNIHARPLIIDK